MPNMSAALTINDGQATPVARSFTVKDAVNRIGTFLEKTAGIALGYIRLTDEYREGKSIGSANSRIIGLEYPTVAVVNGVTTRVRTSSAQVRLNFAKDATDQEKNDIVAYVINYMSHATVRPALYNEDPWF